MLQESQNERIRQWGQGIISNISLKAGSAGDDGTKALTSRCGDLQERWVSKSSPAGQVSLEQQSKASQDTKML